ncbi:MAG: alpha-amylase [Proteobacteria bacterium]|nr:alpha-amylase [Pseudomonadota bacterium]
MMGKNRNEENGLYFTRPVKLSVSSTRIEARLRLYNQYPGSYTNIKAMTRDLERIAAMGFKQVWVNPFYASCKNNFLNPAKINCPYAMRDHTKVDADFAGTFDDIKAYTAKAKDLGLVPLFDLVSLHVGIDHPFVNGDPELAKKGIDTKRWFARHPNGYLKIKGLDEHYNPTSSNPYDDTAAFNYSDPKIREEIIEYFWKPFIDQNIRELGFMGARIDAPGQIPRAVHQELLTYIDQACKETHQREAYLVAETIGQSSKFLAKDVDAIKGLVTHVMNSVWWMPGVDGQENHDYSLWQKDDNWWTQSKGILQGAAPTAGHSGSHDEERFAEVLKHKGITHPAVMKQRTLEKIMQAAFGSDGGHILSYGDEMGVEERINLHERRVIDVSKEKKFDLTSEIAEINQIVSLLPKPTFPEWTQRVFSKEYPELVIFIVHQGEGFTGNSHIIIGNTYNDEDKNIVITDEMIQEILKADGRNDSPEKRVMPSKLYLCGRLTEECFLIPEVHSTRTQGLKHKGICAA